MKRLFPFRWASAGALTCCGSFFLSIASALAEGPTFERSPVPQPTATTPAEPPWQQLLESQQAILKAAEQFRQEVALTSKHQADLVARRIDQLNQSFDSERDREWESILRTHQLALGVASVIAGVTLLGLLLSALLQVRAIRKLTDTVNASLLVGPNDTHLLDSVARIESHLLELERSLAAPPEATAKEIGRTEGSSSTFKPRMALSIGAGDALNFLPTEIKRGPRKSFIARLRKMFPIFRSRTEPASH